MARHFGSSDANAYITSNDDLQEGEKTWIGQAQICPSINSKDGCVPFSNRQHCMMALAGPMAERVWIDSQSADPYGANGDLGKDMNDPDFMSLSDWAPLGVEPGEPLRWHVAMAENVAALLAGELWLALLRETRHLIVNQRRYADFHRSYVPTPAPIPTASYA